MKAEPRTEKKTMGKGVRPEGDLARSFLSKSTPKNLQLRRLANLRWLIATRSCSPSYKTCWQASFDKSVMCNVKNNSIFVFPQKRIQLLYAWGVHFCISYYSKTSFKLTSNYADAKLGPEILIFPFITNPYSADTSIKRTLKYIVFGVFLLLKTSIKRTPVWVDNSGIALRPWNI